MMEIYKVNHDLNPSIMKQIFEEKALPFNLRCSDKLQLSKAKKTCLGTDAVRVAGKMILEALLSELESETRFR